MSQVTNETIESFAENMLAQMGGEGHEGRGQDLATVIGLSGDLGVGKTTLTKSLARALHITDILTSPTFVIAKFYAIPPSSDHSFSQLIHIDAYRLESSDELARLGFLDWTTDPSNLIIIEWPENVQDILPKHTITYKLSILDEQTRDISVF